MAPLSELKYWQVFWNNFQWDNYNDFVDRLYPCGSIITTEYALLKNATLHVFIDSSSFSSALEKPKSLEYYLFIILKHIIHRKLKEKHAFTHPKNLMEHLDLAFPIGKKRPNNHKRN